jgi:hypothetical protein
MICPNRNILDELIFELSELIDTLNNVVEITCMSYFPEVES